MKVYIATCGTGKTYFCQHNPGWVDLDWCAFATAANANEVFIEAAKYYLYWGYNILTNTMHAIYLFQQAGIKIDGIISPSYAAIPDIKQRLQKRQDSSFFGDRYCPAPVFENKQNAGIKKIYLEPGQYLSDILDADGELKNK